MTRENAKDYLPLVQALAEGKTIQSDFFNTGKFMDIHPVEFTHDPRCYRIKPEPKRVPLGPEDVPPGSVLNGGNDDSEWLLIHSINRRELRLSDRNILTYEELSKCGYRIKRPGQDWQPCWKEVSE